MNADVVIVGAGPAGIFTALEMLRRGSKKKIVMVEKGRELTRRSCPKAKTGKCMNCKPVCHITTGFSEPARSPTASSRCPATSRRPAHAPWASAWPRRR